MDYPQSISSCGRSPMLSNNAELLTLRNRSKMFVFSANGTC